MFDAQGNSDPPTKSFSRRHTSGRWQTRTLLDFPSAARDMQQSPSQEKAPSSDTASERYDIQALLDEVTALYEHLQSKPRGLGEIRQFPQQKRDTE
jgi:hypothetical protein